MIPAVRAAGIQVFIVPHHRTRSDDFDNWRYVNPTQVKTKATKSFAVDSWGGEWNPEFGPNPGTSSFWSTGRRMALPIPISTRD
jgi:hypothetical protein